MGLSRRISCANGSKLLGQWRSSHVAGGTGADAALGSATGPLLPLWLCVCLDACRMSVRLPCTAPRLHEEVTVKTVPCEACLGLWNPSAGLIAELLPVCRCLRHAPLAVLPLAPASAPWLCSRQGHEPLESAGLPPHHAGWACSRPPSWQRATSRGSLLCCSLLASCVRCPSSGDADCCGRPVVSAPLAACDASLPQETHAVLPSAR